MAKSNIRIEIGKVVDMAMTQVLDDTTINDISIREWIDKIVNGDYSPMNHGQWIYGENEDGQDGIFCSECDHFVPWYYDYYDKTDDLINDNPRCPNCGARMDGGKNES